MLAVTVDIGDLHIDVTHAAATEFPTMYPTQPTPAPTQPPAVVAREARLKKKILQAQEARADAATTQSNIKLLLLAILSSVFVAYSCIAMHTAAKKLSGFFKSSNSGAEFTQAEGTHLELRMSSGRSRRPV